MSIKLALIKKCKFLDEGEMSGRRYFICILLPPLLGSGIQCPLITKSGQKVPKECPKNKKR